MQCPGKFIGAFVQSMTALVVPERCRICGVHERGGETGALCPTCLADVDYLGPWVCRQCGDVMISGMAAGMLCEQCLRKPPPWDRAVSVVDYGQHVRRLLLRLKYRADTTVLPALSVIADRAPYGLEGGWDYVVPVPLHRRRLQQRGLNQSLLLAQIMVPADRHRIATELLMRSRATIPQTGLDGAARRRNLQAAFTLRDPDCVRGARVLIVDDVFTTGTTVTECSRILRRAKAAEIQVLTFARALRLTKGKGGLSSLVPAGNWTDL